MRRFVFHDVPVLRCVVRGDREGAAQLCAGRDCWNWNSKSLGRASMQNSLLFQMWPMLCHCHGIISGLGPGSGLFVFAAWMIIDSVRIQSLHIVHFLHELNLFKRVLGVWLWPGAWLHRKHKQRFWQRKLASKLSAVMKLRVSDKAACGWGRASVCTVTARLFWKAECRVGLAEKLESGSRLAVRAEKAASRSLCQAYKLNIKGKRRKAIL